MLADEHTLIYIYVDTIRYSLTAFLKRLGLNRKHRVQTDYRVPTVYRVQTGNRVHV